MRATDTSEAGLETLICRALTGSDCAPRAAGAPPIVGETPVSYGGAGWLPGDPADYDREYCLDVVQLAAFLQATQPQIAEAVQMESDTPARRKFLKRLSDEVGKRGVVDVLRHGVQHGAHQVQLFYGAPSPDNAQAHMLYAQNRFTVTRQLRYSTREPNRALDLTLFINGLPVFTFELKNRLTKQTVFAAIEQYRRDRDPREKLFELGRCIAHFAVDENEVWFCTHLQGKESWFLPFNKGYNDGAGNPPNPNGLKTDYLWREALTRESVTDILEHYAQLIEEKDACTGKTRRRQIFPRYHQLDVVRKLLADVQAHGVGKRYLIQHSAGSGKSNSIAWLAHRLIGLVRDGRPVFDSVIVVTDRRILDQQIRDTVKQFASVRTWVGHAERSGDLRRFLEQGKKIIITTLQKFPFILDEIGDAHRGRTFAIIIDEAHSSQGGRASAKMHRALSPAGATPDDAEETFEDAINRLMESRKLLTNASYFAFTATPKNKTLELFGTPDPQLDGTVKRRPFHSYTMKQAIQEGFIIDVLAHYTPVKSYYRLIKTIKDDPEYDVKKARKKLRCFVESHDHPIRLKAEIMIDHFHEQVLAKRKLGGQARAMVVTNSIQCAIHYFHAFQAYLRERDSPYRAIVAFSGEHEYGGVKVTEESLNEFPSSQIPDRIREDPYRFLICADKFQTGYDEPLMHTMYVDKALSGVKAVQTLSRLNRAHPQKRDAYVLDFVNDTETIRAAFEPYYRTTLLADETDPNKLHDLAADLARAQVYTPDDVETLARHYLAGGDRSQLDAVLDPCVEAYMELDEDGQVDFKSKAKAFLRTYSFLSAILPYTYAPWEMLFIFLTFLVPKLPAPVEEDLSKGILDAIDMESYRIEKQATMQIALADTDAEIEPVPTTASGHKSEPEIDRLSNILNEFNSLFGNISWTDADRVHRLITQELPARVAADPAYQNARRNSDAQNARIEHDKALERVIVAMLSDDTQLFKQFNDNEAFRRWLAEKIFELTYRDVAQADHP